MTKNTKQDTGTEKLAIDQNKISKCQHCGENMIWVLRRNNVNTTLTDEYIRNIAITNLGSEMQNWCENCGMFTMQIVVAFDLKKTGELK